VQARFARQRLHALQHEPSRELRWIRRTAGLLRQHRHALMHDAYMQIPRLRNRSSTADIFAGDQSDSTHKTSSPGVGRLPKCEFEHNLGLAGQLPTADAVTKLQSALATTPQPQK
jgi:hypothetical protein